MCLRISFSIRRLSGRLHFVKKSKSFYVHTVHSCRNTMETDICILGRIHGSFRRPPTSSIFLDELWRMFQTRGSFTTAWGKIQQGSDVLPVVGYSWHLLNLPSRTKLWCMLQLRGQILYTPPISTLSLYVLCDLSHDISNIAESGQGRCRKRLVHTYKGK